jgi:lipid-A-disaccharide synthase
MRAAKGRVKFIGIGGATMKAAGLKSIFPISDLSVMGLFAVIAKARTLTRRINQTVDAIISEKPDIVLTIDSPSFAIRVIKKVRKRGGKLPKFYHIVAPQVWAWGANRAEKYANVFDRLYAFFDFEIPYFTKYGLKTIAIGHPIFSVIKNQKIKPNNKKEFITMLPGSRISEAKKIMPHFKKVAECTDAKFAIPVTETTKEFITSQVKNWKNIPKLIPFEKRYELYSKTSMAIATSGTAVVELAIMKVPTVVVYRTSWLMSKLVRLVATIKYASLVNILADKMIFPELLGRPANATNILCQLQNINVEKMRQELDDAEHFWHKKNNPMNIVANGLSN